jgi:hypothetical protein
LWRAGAYPSEADQKRKTARSLPMKSLIAFLKSMIAVRTDGDAGAILLRER